MSGNACGGRSMFDVGRVGGMKNIVRIVVYTVNACA